METNKTLYTWDMCDDDGNVLASGEVKEMSEKYIDLGLPSGTLWAACNVGANAPEEYGGHYDVNGMGRLDVTPPTKEQIEELCFVCENKWTSLNGTEGRLFTGPNGNSIFLPAAGIINNGLLRNAGFDGDYWSGTFRIHKEPGKPANYPRHIHPCHLYIDMIGAGFGYGDGEGDIWLSVRAVKNKDNKPNKRQKQ